MSILATITNFLGGNIFKEIKEGVMAYLPPDLSPTQKAEISFKVQSLLDKKEADANRILSDAAVQLDKRISVQEGSAQDLKSIPFLGAFIIFLRAAQRPIWGYCTIYMDYRWFFEIKTLTEQQQTAMIIINILVLGFLFGERTIKNLEPLITKVFAK